MAHEHASATKRHLNQEPKTRGKHQRQGSPDDTSLTHRRPHSGKPGASGLRGSAPKTMLTVEELDSELHSESAQPKLKSLGRRLGPAVEDLVGRSHTALHEALGLIHCAATKANCIASPKKQAKFLRKLGCSYKVGQPLELALLSAFWPPSEHPAERKNGQNRLYHYALALQHAHREEVPATGFTARLRADGASVTKWANTERRARKEAGQRSGTVSRTSKEKDARTNEVSTARARCRPKPQPGRSECAACGTSSERTPKILVRSADLKKVAGDERALFVAARQNGTGNFKVQLAIPVPSRCQPDKFLASAIKAVLDTKTLTSKR